jgi:cyclopropane fatty-acyl-phospholipid synthase-like methyltransferase
MRSRACFPVSGVPISGDAAMNCPDFRHPTLLWKLLRFVIASSKDHAFLDRRWVPWLFAACPRPMRQQLALRLLAFSQHYWVYQWKYAAELTRSDVLWHEYRRNADSRQRICDKLLRRFLRPQMTVLDFGCGPGFLARYASEHVRRVVATDVSRGVLACARELNAAPNLSYVHNGLADLRQIPDASIDLVYSFAVFQHIRKRQTSAFLREFARVLKPGGQGVCHAILKDPEQARECDPKGWTGKRVFVRMVYYSRDELTRLASEAGLNDIQVGDVSKLAEIHDDIGAEQLVTFRRRPAPARASV